MSNAHPIRRVFLPLLLAVLWTPACGGGSGNTPTTDFTQPDNALPTLDPVPIEITSPAKGTYVKDTVSITAKIGPLNTDDVTVKLYLDGAKVAELDTLPADNTVGFDLDTTLLPDGDHVFRVTATAANYKSTANQRVFRIDNTAPQIAWENPPEGLVASEDVLVLVKYADSGSGVDRVTISVGEDFEHVVEDLGGVPVHGTAAEVPIADLPTGNHDIVVTVFDALGTSTSSTRSFRLISYPPLRLPDIYLPPANAQITDSAIEDLDQDGLPDLLISSLNSVTMHPGVEGGRFGNAKTALEESVQLMVLDDRDMDGVKDLVAVQVTGTESLVKVFKGTIDPQLGLTFTDQLGPTQTLYSNAVDLQLGDFNEDGVQDLLVGTGGELDTIQILLSDETGNFAAPIGFGGIESSVGTRVVDVDGDEHLDVVVLREFQDLVSVYRGDGTGTLSIALDSQLDCPPDAFHVGDMNANGVPDLLIACDPSDGPPFILSYSGNGNGTFTKGQQIDTWTHVDQILIGDEDDDGNLDIFALSKESRVVEIWHQMDEDWFPKGGQQLFQTSPEPQKMALGDVNSDGLIDPIIFDTNQVSVLRSEVGNPRFAVQAMPVPGKIVGVDSGFANLDELPDFFTVSKDWVLVNEFGNAAFPVTTFVSASIGASTHQVDAPFALSEQLFDANPQTLGVPVQILSAKLNIDGLTDVLVRMPDSLQSNGDFIFGFTRSGQNLGPFGSFSPLGLVQTMVSARMDNTTPGEQILVTTSVTSPDPSVGTQSILQIFDTMANSFEPRNTTSLWGQGTDIAVADVNDDNLKDVFVLQPALGNVAFMKAIGAGTIQPPVMYAVGTAPRALEIGDLTQDGFPDVVVANNEGILIAAGRGNGDFDPPVVLLDSSPDIDRLILGDLNQDGALDIIGSNDGTGALIIQMSLSDGSYAPAVQISGPAGAAMVPSQGIFLGDTNSDDCPDIVIPGVESSVLTYYLNSSCFD